MMRVLRAFAAYHRAGVQVMFHYRAEIVLWAIWGLVNPAVLYAMWSAAAASNPDQTAAGMTRGQFAAYYFVVMIVGHVSAAWDVYEMGYLIRSGQLSSLLLRPMLPIWKALAENLSYKVATLLFLVPMWVLFAWLVRPEFHTTAWQFALGCLATFLGAALNFLLGYVVSLVAFWATKLDAMGEVYFGLGMFLGGRFAPLQALPGPVYWLAWALPFRWMFAFPTELLMGKLTDLSAALVGLAVQAAWIVVMAVAFKAFWTVALRKHAAVGG
jgi:ABC-2 type transport system permease protein